MIKIKKYFIEKANYISKISELKTQIEELEFIMNEGSYGFLEIVSINDELYELKTKKERYERIVSAMNKTENLVNGNINTEAV